MKKIQRHLRASLKRTCALLVGLAAGIAWVGMAAEVSVLPADLVSGATDGSVSYSHTPEGYAVMSFSDIIVNPYTPPAYCSGTLVADGGAPDSTFAGDYMAANVTGVTFRVMSDGHKPSTALVLFQSSVSGRIWVYPAVPVSDQAGVWVTCTIPFERLAGWVRGGTDLDAKWAADIRSVGLIGIRITQGGIESQSYTIADFKLIGTDGTGPTADLTALQRALLDRFGVTSPDEVSEQDRQVDSDLDGMTDLIEILSKYDLDYANQIFLTEILGVSDGGVSVKWPCVEGWKYTVLRSERLTDGFLFLPGGAGFDMPAASTGYMTFTDADAAGKSGPFYYMIMKRQ